MLLAVALSGCSNTLTGPQTLHTSEANTYFWPDSDATYKYVSDVDGHTHAIVVKKGAGIVDRDLTSNDSNVQLSVNSSAGTTTLTGLASNDIFSLDRSLLVVADSAPSKNYAPQPVNSITTMNGTMYVLTDTAVYQYFSRGDSLHWFSSWSSLLKGFKLYQDPNTSRLYAAQIGGISGVYSFTNGGKSWSNVSSSTGQMDVFAAGDGKDSKAQYWFSSGRQLFRFDGTNNVPVGPTFLQNITAIEHSGYGGNAVTLVGLSDGTVFSIDRNDQRQQVENMTGPAITSISSGFVGSQKGIYAYGFTRQQVSADPSSIAFSASGTYHQWYLYNALPDNSVTSFDGQSTTPLGKPAQGQISQLAADYMARVYALIGTKVYGYRDSGWLWLARSLPRNAQWLPGGMRLLKDDDSAWVAAYMENLASKVDRGYAYLAKVILKAPHVDLDGIRYNDVIAVRYTANANGIDETATMPEYTIYYERGLGPVRIEKRQGGVTHTTRIVLP